MLLALALAACSQQPLTPAPAIPEVKADQATSGIAGYIAGHSFTFDSGGTVTETFLADGTGEWRRPSGRTGPFTWTVDTAGTFCRVYAPVAAVEGQKAWEGGTWCGTATRVAQGLEYTDQKSGAAGVLKEVVP